VPKVDERLLAHAKQMRTEMTPAEARLWYRLRAGRQDGVKFVRQSVRRPYIADFVARSRKLVIEVDGDTHGSSVEYDARRTAQLERLGFRVLRFANVEVMQNIEWVMHNIVEALATAPLPTSPPAWPPSPRRGEGSFGSFSPPGRGWRAERDGRGAELISARKSPPKPQTP
jgi:very-short-patch-repair endonuclease